MPSVQYLFFDKDKEWFQFTLGLADVGRKINAAPSHRYHAFSTTKTFTALAVLQLAEANLIDIENPAKYYLPSFPYPDDITVKQLLAHTAGIPAPIPLGWIHLVSEHAAFNRNQFFGNLFAKHPKPTAKPNEKFAYSNLGYMLLGQLIEHVSGMKYEQYVSKHILEHLNNSADDLNFSVDGNETEAKGYHARWSFSNAILGFLIDKPKFMGAAEGNWKPFVPYYVSGAPYGGLMATPRAMMHYVQALLQPNGKLLGEPFKRLMFTENLTNNGKATGMCLSWYTGQLNDNTYYTHAGGGGGFYCEIRIYPSHGLGSVMMTNRTGMTDERFMDKADVLFINKK